VGFALKKRGKKSDFDRAADGSMTLIEHVRELRNRLFLASLAVLAGLVVGYLVSLPVFELLQRPYCNLPGVRDADGVCQMIQLGPADSFLLRLKIALWVGLILSAPVWLYQLWAFIAPGLHRHERRYSYAFAAIAAPLFAAGALLAYFIVDKGLSFLLEAGLTGLSNQLEVTRYISFVTNMILIFGVAFEFPLLVLMLNFVGLVSARKLLSWWRVAVFIFFAFSAVVTPTPDPFGMTALAICLCALYFAAVGVAFLNDKRRGRGKEVYAGLDDDQASPLQTSTEPVGAVPTTEVPAPIPASEPVERPTPIDGRYDDMT
jgi:sec-independent protein translocase protein TatC